MCHVESTFLGFLLSVLFLFGLGYHLLYQNLGELLAMATELAIALAAALVEYQYLVALYQWAYYFGHNLCASNGGGAYGDCAVVNEKHLLEFNSLVGLYILDVVHEELLAFFNLELLTLHFYDCVHLFVCCCYLGFSPRGGANS